MLKPLHKDTPQRIAGKKPVKCTAVCQQWEGWEGVYRCCRDIRSWSWCQWCCRWWWSLLCMITMRPATIYIYITVTIPLQFCFLWWPIGSPLPPPPLFCWSAWRWCFAAWRYRFRLCYRHTAAASATATRVWLKCGPDRTRRTKVATIATSGGHVRGSHYKPAKIQLALFVARV